MKTSQGHRSYCFGAVCDKEKSSEKARFGINPFRYLVRAGVPFVILLLIAIPFGTTGCNQAMGGVKYAGGDGSSVENAIVVSGAIDDEQGTLAEKNWLVRHYPGVTTGSQGAIRRYDRLYDEISFVTRNGEHRSVYFDITDYYGKQRSRK